MGSSDILTSELMSAIMAQKPDSSGLPEGLLAQRFERWVKGESLTIARFSVLTFQSVKPHQSK